MGDRSKIEWTEATWNPLVGCSKVSPGCDHCYAVGVVHRGMSPQHRGLTVRTESGVDWSGRINVAPSVMDQPLRWKRPRRVFVNSLSDLFHPHIHRSDIVWIFAVMMLASQHTFQVLTKRPKRMNLLLNDGEFWVDVHDLAIKLNGRQVSGDLVEAVVNAELANVWLGTSIESDEHVWRADHLRATPAAVRWISAEPLLGPLPSLDLTGIDWLVVGGESGPGARPMHPEWVRELRDRCLSPGTTRIVESHHGAARATTVERGPAFFFKQWGDWYPEGAHLDELPSNTALHSRIHLCYDGDQRYAPGEGRSHPMRRLGKKHAGRYLDGRTWGEYPT